MAVTRLYINPAARVPTEVDISGNRLFPLAGDAVVESSADFQPDFYEQPLHTALAEGDVPVYTRTHAQLAAMLDAQPAYMLAPQLSTDTLLNFGFARTTEGPALKNGAALTSTSLSPGTVSVKLDNTNKYVETNWLTWTNLCVNPDWESPGENGKNEWTQNITAGGTVESEETTTAWHITGLTKSLYVKWKRPNDETIRDCSVISRWSSGEKAHPVVAGRNYSFRVPINVIQAAAEPGTPTARWEIWINWRKADGSSITPNTEPGQGVPIGEKGEILLTALNVEAPPEAAYARIIVGANNTHVANATYEFYIGSVLMVDGATIPGFHFPLNEDLTTGLAAFAGAAHASTSDYGPFARNTARTFVGLANRTASGSLDTLFGANSSTSEHPRLILLSELNNFQFRINRSTAAADSQAEAVIWPGFSQNVMFAAQFNDPEDFIKLAVNGGAPTKFTGKTRQFIEPRLYTSGLRIGVELSNTNPFFGNMLPFAVYTRALSDAEIAAIYAP